MADTATKPIVEDVSLKDLKAGLADGSIVLVDVREPHEYAAGHIPGSIAEPAAELRPGRAAGAGAGQEHRVLLPLRPPLDHRAWPRAAAGRDDIRAHYPGGILGWEGAGEPVENFEDSLSR